MTPSEVQQMLHLCEEEAAMMMAKCAEEIQAEKEAKRRCEEVVAERTPLGRVWADFDWEKEERRKREIGEEEEEWREWEREKQMREKLAEAEKEKREGQAALWEKGRNKEGREEARKAEKDWSQQTVQKQVALAEQRDSRLAKGGQNIKGQGETNRKLGREPSKLRGLKKTTRNVKERKRPLKKEDRVSSSRPEPMENSRKAETAEDSESVERKIGRTE